MIGGSNVSINILQTIRKLSSPDDERFSGKVSKIFEFYSLATPPRWNDSEYPFAGNHSVLSTAIGLQDALISDTGETTVSTVQMY